jgi:hypothetical protein
MRSRGVVRAVNRMMGVRPSAGALQHQSIKDRKHDIQNDQVVHPFEGFRKADHAVVHGFEPEVVRRKEFRH